MDNFKDFFEAEWGRRLGQALGGIGGFIADTHPAFLGARLGKAAISGETPKLATTSWADKVGKWGDRVSDYWAGQSKGHMGDYLNKVGHEAIESLEKWRNMITHYQGNGTVGNHYNIEHINDLIKSVKDTVHNSHIPFAKQASTLPGFTKPSIAQSPEQRAKVRDVLDRYRKQS